jgi:hypothetical protein
MYFHKCRERHCEVVFPKYYDKSEFTKNAPYRSGIEYSFGVST